MAHAMDLSGKRVLDLGCAEGLHTLYMAASAEHVTGIDHRGSVVDVAEATRTALGVENVDFLAADVRDERVWRSLPEFDLVVAWGLLHRVESIFSLLAHIATLGRALSLEWRTPLAPFMARLSLAYHSPAGDRLDPMNAVNRNRDAGGEDAAEENDDAGKVEGKTGFWEPTPGAVHAICRRLGYDRARLIGYGEDFDSQARTIRREWARHVRRRVLRKRRSQQLPMSRVHMLFERGDARLDLSDPRSLDARLAPWDARLHQRLKGER